MCELDGRSRRVRERRPRRGGFGICMSNVVGHVEGYWENGSYDSMLCCGTGLGTLVRCRNRALAQKKMQGIEAEHGRRPVRTTE